VKILLIEDDELVAQKLKQALTDREYVVDVAADGQIGWELIEAFSYDLILLDIILPKLDGIALCRQLRSQRIRTPVILITAIDTTNKKVIGLDAGADDYITKPFDLEELLARMRALLRRGVALLPPVLTWGKLNLNPNTMEVSNRGKLLRLTPKEYSILELFLRNPHRVFSRSLILDRIWSFEVCPSEDTVTAHVKGLRLKLKNAGAGDPIETVYGVGYRLKTHETLNNKSKSKQQDLNCDRPSVAVTTSLWQHLQAKFNERLTPIERAIDLSFKNCLETKLQREARDFAHKLVGSLGIFNLFQASDRARIIEEIFHNSTSLNYQQKEHLSELVGSIRQELNRAFALAPYAKVTIFDEDPAILREVTNFLQPWGVEITSFRDAGEFRATFPANCPDLLILNVTMSPTSGLELCQIVRRDFHRVKLPVLLLTDITDASIRQQIFSAGADDYLTKPILGPELLARTLNCLEKTRSLKNKVDLKKLYI